jgi:hypothetical protein
MESRRSSGRPSPTGRENRRKKQSQGDDRKGQRGPRSVDASLVKASAEDAYPSIGVAPARDLRVDVDPGGLQRRVVGLDVAGRDDDAGVDGCRAALPWVARSTIAVDPPAGATSIQRIFPSANVSSERSSNPSVPWSGSQVRAVCGVRTHVPLRGSTREFGIGADDRVLSFAVRRAGDGHGCFVAEAVA